MIQKLVSNEPCSEVLVNGRPLLTDIDMMMIQVLEMTPLPTDEALSTCRVHKYFGHCGRGS